MQDTLATPGLGPFANYLTRPLDAHVEQSSDDVFEDALLDSTRPLEEMRLIAIYS